MYALRVLWHAINRFDLQVCIVWGNEETIGRCSESLQALEW